jgi:hypothetical protein
MLSLSTEVQVMMLPCSLLPSSPWQQNTENDDEDKKQVKTQWP